MAETVQAAQPQPTSKLLDEIADVANKYRAALDPLVSYKPTKRTIVLRDPKPENAELVYKTGLEMLEKLYDIMLRYDPQFYASSYATKLKALKEYAGKIGDALKKLAECGVEDGKLKCDLDAETRKALAAYAIMARAIGNMLYASRSSLPELVEKLRELPESEQVKRIKRALSLKMAAAVRYELQKGEPAPTAHDWLREPNRYYILGVDHFKEDEAKKAVAKKFGVKPRGARREVREEEVKKAKEEAGKTLSVYREIVEKVARGDYETDETGALVVKINEKMGVRIIDPDALAALAERYNRGLELLENPDQILEEFRVHGRPLYEYFARKARFAGVSGLGTAGFIAAQYANKLFGMLYPSARELAKVVGSKVAAVFKLPREELNIVRRIVFNRVAEEVKNAGLENVKLYELSEPEARETARKIAEAVARGVKKAFEEDLGIKLERMPVPRVAAA